MRSRQAVTSSSLVSSRRAIAAAASLRGQVGGGFGGRCGLAARCCPWLVVLAMARPRLGRVLLGRWPLRYDEPPAARNAQRGGWFISIPRARRTGGRSNERIAVRLAKLRGRSLQRGARALPVMPMSSTPSGAPWATGGRAADLACARRQRLPPRRCCTCARPAAASAPSDERLWLLARAAVLLAPVGDHALGLRCGCRPERRSRCSGRCPRSTPARCPARSRPRP